MAHSFFSHQLVQTINGYLNRYETKRSSILPILHAIQDEKDWISEEDIQALEKEFSLPVVEIREVLTFYTMYRTAPPKPLRFEVCNSISCWLMGSQKTIDHIEGAIEAAEQGGKPLPISCLGVECLGVCGYAPVVLVNKDRHLNVDAQRAQDLIQEYVGQWASNHPSSPIQNSEKGEVS